MADVYVLHHSEATDVLHHTEATDVYLLHHTEATDVYLLLHLFMADVLVAHFVYVFSLAQFAEEEQSY